MNVFGLSITRTKAATKVTDLSPLRSAASSQGWYGIIRESLSGAWQKNVVVDSTSDVLACAPVYACIDRISSDIAKLRIRLVEQQRGIWTEVERQSPFWMVLRRPNHYQNRIQFMVAWLTSKLMFGNTYVLKERDSRGLVVKLHVLDPRRVTPLVAPSGDVYYQLSRDDLAGVTMASVPFPAAEIIHDRGVTLFHPLVGVSPLYAAAAAATQSNRMQNNSAKFFENMSRPSGILTAPGTIDEMTATRLKEAFEQNFAGSNLGRLAVAGDGLTYQPLTIPAKDAELVEQLKWTGEDIARAFKMPGYKIGVGPMPTNNNVQALNQQYYQDCLQKHIEDIELCLDEGLGLAAVQDRVYGTEFDLDGLLRMDAQTTADYLQKMVGGGVMTPNEARARVNLGTLTGGDTVYLQQQQFSIEALAKRDATDDPFGKAAPAPSPTPAPAPAAANDAKAVELKAMTLLEMA